MICENCGHECNPGNKFCGKCGTPLNEQQNTQAEQSEPTQEPLPEAKKQQPELQPPQDIQEQSPDNQEQPPNNQVQPQNVEIPDSIPKKANVKRMKLFICIAGILAVVLSAGGFAFYKYSVDKELSEKIPELNAVMGEFENLYLDLGNNRQEYENLLKEVNIQNEKKDLGVVKSLLAKATELQQKVQSDNDNKLAEIEDSLSVIETGLSNSLTDNFADEIVKLKTKIKSVQSSKNCKEAIALLDTANDLKDKVDKENKSILDSKLDFINSKDISLAFEEEIKQIESFKVEYTALLNQSKFSDANDLLDKWEAFVYPIENVNDNYNISVNQVDFSEFPKIKLFLTIDDMITGKVPAELSKKFFFISENDAKNPEFLRDTVNKVTQLNQKEKLNINIVADCSDSMTGYPINTARYIMNEFLNYVQFNIGDKVELTSFSDYVFTDVEFTNSKQAVSSAISNLNTYSMTALYDALFAAVNTTAIQPGAKCVIAFTDGMDNVSNISVSEVINQANRYNVPIFIIGIGNGLDDGVLSNIANSTNGFYTRITDVSDLADIYRRIYAKNKEMYVVEYETQNKEDVFGERTVKINIRTENSGGSEVYRFTPVMLGTAEFEAYSTDTIDKLMGAYLKNYIHAINNHDYSYIVDYIAPGGGVEREVKPYIQKDIQEKLLSYEIIEKNYTDANTCIVTTRETYMIQNRQEPLHARVLLGKYKVIKSSDGKWRLLDFADRYKVLSKTAR